MKRNTSRVALAALAGLALAGAAALAQDRGRDRRARDRAPAVGQEAPDFDLPRLVDGELSQAPGHRVRLSALRGKPVALIFGSYT